MKPIASSAAVPREFGGRLTPLRPLGSFWAVAVSCLLSACGASTGPTLVDHGMRLGASARLVHNAAGDSVQTVLTVQNVADSTQSISWATCPSNGPVLLVAYKAGGNTSAAWDSQDAYSKVICAAIAQSEALAPGETWQYEFAVPVATILGDSLAPGPYSFDVSAKYLSPGFPEEIPVGTLSLVP